MERCRCREAQGRNQAISHTLNLTNLDKVEFI